MKTTTILIALLLLTACDRRYYQVTCDSGFKTPISTATHISEGMISWRTKGDLLSKRKMLPGEICTEKSITIKG